MSQIHVKRSKLAILHLGVRCEVPCSYSDFISKTSNTSPLTNTGTKIGGELIKLENPKHKGDECRVSALELGDRYLPWDAESFTTGLREAPIHPHLQ